MFAGDTGPATKASLNAPSGLAIDGTRNIYVADRDNHRIRKIRPDGTITTIAGNGTPEFSGDGAPATQAGLNQPSGVAVDASGNIFVADKGNHRIRKIGPDGNITTIAGTGTAGYSGDSGPAAAATLSSPSGIALDSAGTLYLADTGNHAIRCINGGTISTVAGKGVSGYTGDGGPATAANLSSPTGVGVDQTGDVYVADTSNYRVRRFTPGGNITAVAGSGASWSSGDGGPATMAGVYWPTGVFAYGSALYIAEYSGHRVRKIGPGATISTYAGTTTGGGSDGGWASNAALGNPAAVVCDPDGNLYIADSSAHQIRKVSLVDGTGAVLIVSGNYQTRPVTTRLLWPLVVQVLDASLTPKAGVTVNFAVTEGAGTFESSSVVTGVDGIAQATLTLGNLAGMTTLTATAAGVPPAVFTITAQPGPAASIVVLSGNDQTGVAGEFLPVPLLVRVLDQFGNPLQYPGLRYGVSEGGGSLSDVGISGRNGEVETRWKLGKTPSSNTVLASIQDQQFLQVTFHATGTAPPGASISILGGNYQSAEVGQALANLLTVRVSSQTAPALAGIEVKFEATPAASFSLSYPTTDTSGQVSAAVTLGKIAGPVTITASVSGFPAAAVFTATARPAPASQLTIVSGDFQIGPPGAALASPFVVKAADADGNPISGVQIGFLATAGGGSLSAASAVTDSDGLARVTLTLGTNAGTNAVRASSGTLQPVSFTATATATLPAAIVVVSGNNQSGVIRATLAGPLLVQVNDASGTPLPGVNVAFAVGSGDAALSGSSAVTNASGQASVSLTFGTRAGAVAVNASAGGFSTTFTLTSTAGAAFQLKKISTDWQCAVIGSMLPDPEGVQLLDAYDNPIAGATVLFEILSGGGSATPVSAATDAAGKAQASWTLGSTPGNQSLRAIVGGVAAVYWATATAVPPAAIVVVSGNNQSAAVNTSLPSPLVVQVNTAAGTGLPGITVYFTADVTFSASSVVTDSNGRAETRVTFWQTPGLFPITAAVTNPTYSVQFNVTATAGQPASISLVSGDNQTAAPGNAVPNPVVVKVVDQSNKWLDMVLVRFVVTSGGGSVSLPSVTTGLTGQAQVSWTLGNLPGLNTLAVYVGSLAPVTVTATGVGTPAGNLPGGIAIISGNNQSAKAGTALTDPLVVQVTSTSGASLPGVTVDFIVTQGAATLSSSHPLTGADGRAQVSLTLGTTPGEVRISASVAGVPSTVLFSATASQPSVPYLVGDAFPTPSAAGDLNLDGDYYDAGEFGDGSLTILDLIYALRAVTSVPGHRPPTCSDRFDAIDSFPKDTDSTRGGDGILNTVDLIMTLRRVTNVDTARPQRLQRTGLCGSQAPGSPATMAARAGGNEAGISGEFGEGIAVGHSLVRVPLFLQLAGASNLAGLSLAVGMSDGQAGARLRFVPADGVPAPSLIDDQLPGVLALAWLDGLRLPDSRRVLLGYVEVPAVPAGVSLRFYGASANTSDGSELRLTLPAPSSSFRPR